MRQIEKNKKKLWEEIELLCDRPINRTIADELSKYAGAYNVLCMICEDDSSGSESDALTPQMAQKWAAHMKNEDGTSGPHWTQEKAKEIMEQHNMHCDPLEFWVALNAMYSDYFKVAKKNNVNTVDFYVDMAEAFLDDEDAMPGKPARYYEYVVKH